MHTYTGAGVYVYYIQEHTACAHLQFLENRARVTCTFLPIIMKAGRAGEGIYACMEGIVALVKNLIALRLNTHIRTHLYLYMYQGAKR